MNRVFEVLPDDLPEPMPDGAERHLLGSRLPDIVLGATSGKEIRLAELLKPTVLFFYPRTGVRRNLVKVKKADGAGDVHDRLFFEGDFDAICPTRSDIAIA